MRGIANTITSTHSGWHSGTIGSKMRVLKAWSSNRSFGYPFLLRSGYMGWRFWKHSTVIVAVVQKDAAARRQGCGCAADKVSSVKIK
jgi:hypothetical protein